MWWFFYNLSVSETWTFEERLSVISRHSSFFWKLEICFGEDGKVKRSEPFCIPTCMWPSNNTTNLHQMSNKYENATPRKQKAGVNMNITWDHILLLTKCSYFLFNKCYCGKSIVCNIRVKHFPHLSRGIPFTAYAQISELGGKVFFGHYCSTNYSC